MDPHLQRVDSRRDVRRLDVPVYVVEGAPGKPPVTFESSGHEPHLDEPGRFAELMADVLAATQPVRAAR